MRGSDGRLFETLLMLTTTGLLIAGSSSWGPSIPQPRYCPQDHPIELLVSNTSKTFVRKNMCGEIVRVENLTRPPTINVAGLNQKGNYSVFLLKQNGPNDGTYSIVWHLAHAQPFGDTLTKNQSTPLPVMIHYNPPPNITANMSVMVFEERLGQGPLVSRLSAPNHYAFSPSLWVRQFHEGEMTLISQSDFLLLAGWNTTTPPPPVTTTSRPPPPPPPAPVHHHTTPPPPSYYPQPQPAYPPPQSYPGHPIPMPGSGGSTSSQHKKSAAGRAGLATALFFFAPLILSLKRAF